MKDKWARIIGVPIVSLIMAMAFDFDKIMAFDGNSLIKYLITVLFTVTLWEGNRFIFFRLRQVYPHYRQTSRRIGFQTLLSILLTLVVSFTCPYLLRLTLPLDYCNNHSLWIDFLTSLAPTFFITSIYESAYFFGEWRKNIQKTEALARENIQSQFEALKNQVDPHFLFNSLNTLAALIDEDNDPAQKYLEQLSDVYRYVLLNKDRSTVTLEEELAFVESYLYLNKTRFRENLQVETRISEMQQNRKIAPLSLQMLVENAIKHNVISRDKPLTIRISQENDWITVENNVQEKSVFEKSTKVGLQNIINRYSYLSTQPVEITNEPGLFTVRLPLLPA